MRYAGLIKNDIVDCDDWVSLTKILVPEVISCNNEFELKSFKLKYKRTQKISFKCEICGATVQKQLRSLKSFICQDCMRRQNNKEIIKKMKQTKLKKYGDENYNNQEQRKKKINFKLLAEKTVKTKKMNGYVYKQRERTFEEKQEAAIKSKQTKLKKYGDENYNNQNKRLKTIKEKYGDFSFIKNSGKYKYDNCLFDSGWEVAYYIYCKNNNIKCERNKDIKFIYYVNGKKHYYLPDFITEDGIIEIKGEKFFDKNGNPLDSWKEKYNCLQENNVILIRKNNLKIIFDFMRRKFGSRRKFYLFLKEECKR